MKLKDFLIYTIYAVLGILIGFGIIDVLHMFLKRK